MTNTRRGVSLALAAAALAGAFMVPFKAAADGENGRALAFLLLLFAAVYNSLAAFPRQPRALLRRKNWRVALYLAAFSAAGNLASATAIGRLDPTVLITLLQTQLLWVALFAWLWLKEGLSGWFMLGATIALMGVAVMRVEGLSGATTDGLGMLLALSAAACFAMLGVITRRFVQEISLLAVNSLRLWFAALLALATPGTWTEFRHLSTSQVALIALAALFGPTLARLLLMQSAHYLKAAHSTLVQLSGPVFALLFSATILGQTPTRIEALGAILLLLGVAVPWSAQLLGRRYPRTP